MWYASWRVLSCLREGQQEKQHRAQGKATRAVSAWVYTAYRACIRVFVYTRGAVVPLKVYSDGLRSGTVNSA